MWFPLSVLALFMLSVRRSVEKDITKHIDSMAMSWLQQAVALPLIIATLFFAKFYWPGELSAHFWQLLAVYAVCSSMDLYCYFKAISIADLSYVAPLLSLFAVGNLIAAYFVLGQKPSAVGATGAFLIMIGAYITHTAKQRQQPKSKANRLALILVLICVVLRSYYSNIEVSMLRLSNPTSYNLYSSLVIVSLVLLVSSIVVRQRRSHYDNYWGTLKIGVRQNVWPLVFIGVTYTINLLATYEAKLLSPDAAYVGAVKSAALLPVVLIGIFFFKEKVGRLQWIGMALILLGLVAVATN